MLSILPAGGTKQQHISTHHLYIFMLAIRKLKRFVSLSYLHSVFRLTHVKYSVFGVVFVLNSATGTPRDAIWGPNMAAG